MNGVLARIREWAASGTRTVGKPRIGLALGGGFARGMAHLGVLKILEENNIPIHAVAGTSAGSIVAAAWAGGRTVAQMTTTIQSLRFRDFGAWSISRLALASNEPRENSWSAVSK